MVSEFLIKKWKTLFQVLDVNKDGVICEEDAELFVSNFADVYTIKDTEAHRDLHSDSITFWQGFLSRGNEKTTEDHFISSWSEQFSQNEEEFIQNIRKLFSLFVSLIDHNNDGFISKEEMKNSQKALGKGTFHEKHFGAYPHAESGEIRSELFLESWVAFCCNQNETDVFELERARLYEYRLLSDIKKDLSSG